MKTNEDDPVLSPTISLTMVGSVATLTLNRPDNANAISLELAREFGAAVAMAESDADCRVLVIAGNGKLFCAGGDVAEMADASEPSDYLQSLAREMGADILALVRSRLVVISRVHGAVAGAGLAIVLASDLAVASTTASFRAAYGAIGLTPDCGVSLLLPDCVGPRRAAQMCLNAHVVSGVEAAEWGIVTRVVSSTDLDDAIDELTNGVAAIAERSLAPTKALLKAALLKRLPAVIERESRQIAVMAKDPSTQARIAKFAKR